MSGEREVLQDLLELYASLKLMERSLSSGKEVRRSDVREIVSLMKSVLRNSPRISAFLTYSLPALAVLRDDPRTSLDVLIRTVERAIIMSRRRYLRSKVGFRWSRGPLATVPLEDLSRRYEYISGYRPFLLTVPHAKKPFADKEAEEIGSLVAKKTGAHLLIFRVSRVYMDCNRFPSRLSPLRVLMERIIRERGIRGVLDLHTCSGDEFDVELGFFPGQTVDPKTVNDLRASLESFGVRVSLDGPRIGGDIVWECSSIPGVWGVQLEVSESGRRKRKEIVKALSKFFERVGEK